MSKLQDVYLNNKKIVVSAGAILAVILVIFAGVFLLKKPKEQAYYYEDKVEARLAQNTIDYLDQHVVMKTEDLEEMGNVAVETYRTVVASGVEEITDEHSLAVQTAINDALYTYLDDETLSPADYEALSMGISQLIWDILLTELINSELAINVSYQEEFNDLTASLQAQIREIEEKMEKLKVNATIKFNTDEVQEEINKAIVSSLDQTKNEIYENLDNEIASAVEKEIQKEIVNTEKEIIDSINQDIDDISNDIAKEVQSKVRNGQPGKDGQAGAAGKDGQPGAAGKDGVNGKDGAAGKDGIDGKDGAAGKDGADGTNSYIVFSEYPAGVDNAGAPSFSTTPSAKTKYMGVASTVETTAPTNASAYQWTQYKELGVIYDDSSGTPTLIYQ